MNYFLPNGVEIDLDVALKRAWNGGFVTELTLRNVSNVPLEDWSLGLDLAPGIDVRAVANMGFEQDGTVLSITPDAPWLRTISPDEEVTLTFRSVGEPGDIEASVVPAFASLEGVPYDLSTEPQGDGGGAGDVTSDIIVKNVWNSGAWIQITLTNDGPDAITGWTLPVDFPDNLSFAQSGNVNLVTLDDGSQAFRPAKAFLETIAPGQTIVLGLNLDGTGGQAAIKAAIGAIGLGDLEGATPPTALNDRPSYDFDGEAGTVTIQAADLLANDAAADGGAVQIVDAFTTAGGGSTTFADGVITYEPLPSERGRVVIGYVVEDEDGLIGRAQAFVDLPTPPALTVGDVTVDEDAGTASFDVTLTGDLTFPNVEVDFETRAREARAERDFVAQEGSLSFSEAERTRTVEVELIDDGAFELTETFDLVLSNARGAVIEGLPGVAKVLDDAGDTGPLGQTTAGVDLSVELAGEFVVGYTPRVTLTNTTDGALDEVVFTVGVQDGMDLRGFGGLDLLANHDDRYFTFGLDLDALAALELENVDNSDVADGSFDPGDSVSADVFFFGSHFFVPLAERIELSPAALEAGQPERPFVPLDLERKGFNTAFFNRSEVTDADVAGTFEDAADVGANAMAIVTTHFAANRTASSIFANDFTMTDADLRDAIGEAQDQGLSVLLKPHLDLGDGRFRGRLNPDDEAAFFGRQEDGSYAQGSYGELITRYAGIAEEEGVETMLVGTELVDLAKDRANLPFWTQLIEDVREIAPSVELSYATIVGEELFVRFWDQLDAISLDIYPPLTDNTAPSVGELTQGWTDTPTTARSLEAYFEQPVLDLIAGMAEQYDLPVYITETGFRSVDGAAGRPFDFNLQGFADLQEQVDAYQALFAALQQEAGAYLDGVYLWEWDTQPAPADGTINQVDSYFTANKPALETVEDFFAIV